MVVKGGLLMSSEENKAKIGVIPLAKQAGA
jgi:hypothetical protein